MSALEAIPEESAGPVTSSPNSGPVSGLLPWRWSTPPIVHTAAVILTSAYGKVKSSHQLCRRGLEAAEGTVIGIGTVFVKAADEAAVKLDAKVIPWVEEAKSKAAALHQLEKTLAAIHPMERLASTRGVQLGLRAMDSLLQVVETWTVSYQMRYLRSVRRWMRSIRRSGLPKDLTKKRVDSPRKRVKLMERIWHCFSSENLSKDNSNAETSENPHQSSPDEDKKRKLEEVCADSDDSSSGSDYHPEDDEESTDSLEYRSEDSDQEETEEQTALPHSQLEEPIDDQPLKSEDLDQSSTHETSTVIPKSPENFEECSEC